MHLSAEYLWLIPALPLLAAGVTTTLRRDQHRLSALLSIGALATSLVLAVVAFVGLLGREPGAAPEIANFTWFQAGGIAVQLGWVLDPLSAAMAVMVCFVGLLIFVFSSGYMEEDPRAGRFFTFLSLFAGGMLGLVISNSLLLLFMCWEVIGLASFLLIGFWHHKPSAVAAAKKAFITTRIGDIGFLIGLVWLQNATGTTLFFNAGAGCLESGALQTLAAPVLGGALALSTAIGLLLFCGAIGKSGQFPLHVWLPDAMEGPTPVSALIHAATLVAAGVFLMARVFPLLQVDQALASVSVHALTVVTVIGAVTALLGAVIAIGQSDIKRVLAFSTVSQLGYMMVAVGVGAWTAAVFHLLTHAFFKALLFLGSGSVIHASHHEQDIRNLGGLAGRMRVTFTTFAIGTCALTGVPFLFSGFWSKEAVLHAAHGWSVSHLPFGILLVGVACTSFYMTRLVAEVFAGKSRATSHGDDHGHAHEAHESGARMTIPLVLLAAATVGLSLVATPAWPWLQSFLAGRDAEFDLHALTEGGALMWLSIAIVGAGIGLGWTVYGVKPRVTAGALDPLQKRAPGVFAALAGRLGFDELYAATFGRLLEAAVRGLDSLDRRVIGGMVQGTASLSRFAGATQQELEEEVADGGVTRFGLLFRRLALLYSRLQRGDAQGYLKLAVAGFAVVAAILLWGGVR
ncbi:NADH-quinone oxidoreductase subunit L [Nibricoccus sp. IMCC34717]|uniref:NADH-quinone oxidoreductase subunit L n=1 Tax=Nibricoccus sp. IMCC34717 TaxID=3034021 RepID=UPI00384EC431